MCALLYSRMSAHIATAESKNDDCEEKPRYCPKLRVVSAKCRLHLRVENVIIRILLVHIYPFVTLIFFAARPAFARASLIFLPVARTTAIRRWPGGIGLPEIRTCVPFSFRASAIPLSAGISGF